MKTNLFKSIAIAAILVGSTACGSAPASFVGSLTDALDDSAWESSAWISAPDAQVVTGTIYDGTRSADGASWFVATVRNGGKVASAKWMTTGLGVYELYLNGQVVGEEILKPGFTHYGKTKRSFTYDVTDAINSASGAENVLAVQVTPGWWADKIITPAGHEGMIGKKVAFRGVLELTYADGSKELFGTDTENWKAGIAGPVKHAAIFDGEDYDARELPGYACTDRLGVPEINNEFNGEILPTCGAEIYLRKDIALKPVKAYVWKDVEGATEDAYGKVVISREYAAGEPMTIAPGETLVVDFGQNAAAVPSFVFNAKEGTVLTCLPSELLNDGNGAKSRGMDGPEGSCHRLNLRIPQTGMILNYTFAESKKPVAFTPTCTFFGYRLVSITATDEVTIDSIESIPVTSISKGIETGTITTGNELVNRLISNTVWGQRSNYLSVTTDCPQRNERLGWTADTQVFTETGSFFANTSSFFHKWMRDMRDSQHEKGGFPGVAPWAQYGNDPMRLGWADAGVIVPYQVWKQFGDTKIVAENWAAMEKYVARVAETKYEYEATKGENGGFQWADWLSYEDYESCSGKAWKDSKKAWRGSEYRPETKVYWNYLGACYWLWDAQMMETMAKVVGKDAAKYAKMADEARAYLKATFFDPKDGLILSPFRGMQTPALFALKFGLVEGEAKAATIAALKQNFKDHGDCLQTGFLGTSIIMDTLVENGMADIAYTLLLQHKNPSWLYSVDQGATTVWERWNSYTKKDGFGPVGMNSFNHYAYGAVLAWIYRRAAGIAADPANPGFRNIIMAPVPSKRLGFVKAEYRSRAGLIKSAWKYEGDKWIWDFTVPEGATAIVTLPGETAGKPYDAGTYHIER